MRLTRKNLFATRFHGKCQQCIHLAKTNSTVNNVKLVLNRRDRNLKQKNECLLSL